MEVTIKTRFDIGNVVYFLHHNHINKAKIYGITARYIQNKLVKEKITIYTLAAPRNGEIIYGDFNESILCASKEELVNKLLNE